MGYRVSGILKLPDGTPANNAEIEFISRKNFSPLVQELKSNIKCSATGAYDVTLEYGEYAVVVYPGGTYPAALGTIILAADTVAGQDLPTLLQQAGWQPATPEYIQQIAAWLANANASAASSAASASAAKVSETNSKASEIAAEADRSEVAANTADVRVKHSDVVAKSAQVSIDSSATQAAKSTAVSAADTATQKALAAAESEASAFSSATRAEASAVKSADDGAAQAALAKSQADMAKAEADRAKTEADRASDAIGLAALPLPDVWAPLTDSLRLFTGYGREVKVGEDVVARMVNFSRSTTATYIGKDGQLKTAAANEPRFEKEGLLIEGQSTNLFLYSKSPDSYMFYGRGDNTSYIKITDGVRITGIGYYSHHVLPVIAGQIYTFSVTCKVLSGTLDRVGLEGDASLSLGSGLTPEDGTVRLSGTVRPNVNGHATCVYYPTQNSVVEFTDIQFEALPFASSYIPTNGAAVTRAADVCWLPVENGGLPGMDNEKTMSLTSNILGVNGPYNLILATPWGSIDYTPTHERVSGNTPELVMNTPVALKTSVRKVARFTKGGGCAAIFGDIQKTGPTADWSLSTPLIAIGSMNEAGAYPHFGHVKDLKIWLKPLSDDQMKAIA